jgi:RNA-directed DNA polymerase
MNSGKSERPDSTEETGEPSRGTPRREEGRRVTEPLEGTTTGTRNPEAMVSPGLQRIAMQAREKPERAFVSLAHHIDIDLMREAFRRTRKDGATGVDGQTGDEYGENLAANLSSLLDRFKSGQYKAPPVRRTWIPKGDGSQRPLGIPTFEDKVLQQAVKMVLEAVYEQDFLPCSHGYRPGRSAQTALARLDRRMMTVGGGWVLELDIRKFFDSLDHSHLRGILDLRVRDGVLRRTIDKWLAAGVMDGLELSHPDAGTPQGGVISPLLANVYLHEVLDRWFEREVKPRLKGRLGCTDTRTMRFCFSRTKRMPAKSWMSCPSVSGGSA